MLQNEETEDVEHYVMVVRINVLGLEISCDK
jgi:hypothetical protein